MEKNEFKDRVFDLFNDTEEFRILNIASRDREDILDIFLSDKSVFRIKIEKLPKL